MIFDTICIPSAVIHHPILLNAVYRVVLVVLLFGCGHEIAQTGVFAVANQAQVAEGVENLRRQGIVAGHGILRVVVLN